MGLQISKRGEEFANQLNWNVHNHYVRTHMKAIRASLPPSPHHHAPKSNWIASVGSGVWLHDRRVVATASILWQHKYHSRSIKTETTCLKGEGKNGCSDMKTPVWSSKWGDKACPAQRVGTGSVLHLWGGKTAATHTLHRRLFLSLPGRHWTD